jgi:large subunit ribosomal protein L21
MYAVISSGGKQYRLTEGSVVEVERLAGNVGDQVVFDQVLMLGGGDDPVIGTPLVEKARVLGTIVDQKKGDKVIVFKFKRRKMYRKKAGHRQLLTRVKVESVQPQGETAAASGKAAAKRREKAAEEPASSEPQAEE